MKKFRVVNLIAAVLAAIFFSFIPKEIPRPNVILINVDDLGWKDVGFMGGDYYETPNLDRLAAQAVVFQQAYAGASNCAPSRANMLTGRYGMTHGIYTVTPADRGNPQTRKLIPIPNSDHIPADSYTLAMFFRDLGYKTGIFGKWHISEDPKDFGFEVNLGGGPQGNPGRDGYFSPYKINSISPGPPGEYLTDRLTEEAIQFVKANQSQPFFLYLPFYTVHSPLLAKPELRRRFEQKAGVPGRNNPTYAAMIYSMDQNVGRLLAEIQTLGLEENTLLIFTSDNGGVRATSYQDPLRAGKGSFYEGGIRVPMFFRWIGQFDPTVLQTPVSQMDIFPSLRDLLQRESEQTLDGSSILPLLRGKKMEDRDLFWHFPIYLEAYDPQLDQSKDPLFRTRPGSVIRSGNWKLHHYFENDEWELYNLAENLGELENQLESHPQIAQEMKAKLNAWRQQTYAPIPTEPNPRYDAAVEKKLIQEALLKKL